MQDVTVLGIKNHLIKQFNLPEEQIEQMIPNFIDTLKLHMKTLQEALEDGSPELLGKAGHTLKGACLNLGLQECAGLALKIEKSGKAGDNDTEYGVLIEELQQKMEVLFAVN